jgi:hypothetical protein
MVVFFVSAGSHARGSGAFAVQLPGRFFSACVWILTSAVQALRSARPANVLNTNVDRLVAFMYVLVGELGLEVAVVLQPGEMTCMIVGDESRGDRG